MLCLHIQLVTVQYINVCGCKFKFILLYAVGCDSLGFTSECVTIQCEFLTVQCEHECVNVQCEYSTIQCEYVAVQCE